MICLIVFIPVVILKTTPKIRGLRSEIELAEKKAAEMMAEAENQMTALNNLFTDRDALSLIESTVPQLTFDECFSAEQEAYMKSNYDFGGQNDEQSALEVLAGRYNGNPFLFENKLIHTMGTETYHGYKTISWTETYRDSNGKLQTRTKTQKLHATVTKPKPFYSTQVVLHYGSQAGPELSFSREASHVEQKSEKAIERHIKQGEKKLKKMEEKALAQNADFTSMSNSEFEVLFNALDRTEEVQFRTIFTPLAQQNMTKLLLSKSGYGDDFRFIKKRRINEIISEHSQKRTIRLFPSSYVSNSFDTVKENFVNKNAEFFKAVYFDFAPLLAIPVYQEQPVNSLNPVPDYEQLYSQKEYEVLANALNSECVVHKNSKTRAILKTSFVKTKEKVDEICVTAYSYDIEPRIETVPVWGGDGRFHNVDVPWDEYIPLKAQNNFFVGESETVVSAPVSINGLCIFN